MPNAQALPPDVVAALRANRKIDAIKLLRAYGNYDLKEAKAVIDEHLKDSREKYPQIQKESGLGRLFLIAVFVVGACAAYFLAG